MKVPTPLAVWGKRVVFGAGVALVSLIVLLLLLRVLVGTSMGRNFIEARIEAASVSGQSIEIDDLSGDVFSGFEVGQVRVSDSEGVWLVARDVAVDWKPMRLLGGALDADAISISNVDVARLPVLVRKAQTDTGGSSFLKKIDVAQFDLQRLTVSDAVTPQAADVSVMGNVKYAGKAGDLKLQVAPLDGQGDTLSADIQLDQFVPLTATVDLDGPAGGMFASLARLAPAQSLKGTLVAGGETSDWSGTLALQIDGVGLVAIKAVSDGVQATFEGSATPGLHPLAEVYRDWLGDDVTFDGTFAKTKRQSDLQVNIQAANVTGKADIALPENGVRSAAIVLDAEGLSELFPDLPVGAQYVSLTGDVLLPKEGLVFEGDAALTQLVYKDSVSAKTVAGPLKLSLVGQTISVDTGISTSGVRVAEALQAYLGTSPLLKLSGSFDRDTQQIEVKSAAINSPKLRATAIGHIRLGSELKIDASGSMNLKAPKSSENSHPAINAKWSARQNGDGPIRLSANGRVSAFAGLPEPLGGWLVDGARFDVSGTAQPDGRVMLPKVSLTSDGLNADARLNRTANGELTAAARVQTGAVKTNAYETEPLALDIALDGALDALSYTLMVDTAAVTAGGMALTAPKLDAVGTFASGALTGAIKLVASTETGPLAITSDVALDGGAWTMTNFDASLSDLVAKASLSGSKTDLASVLGEAEIKGVSPIESFKGRIDVTARMVENALSAEGSLADFSFGEASFDTITFNASGTPGAVKVTARADGMVPISGIKQEAQITLDGTAQNVLTEQRAAVFDVSGALGEAKFSSVSPIALRQSPRGIETDAVLSVMDGKVALSLSDKAAARAVLKIEGVSLKQATEMIGRAPMGGRLDADIALQDFGANLVGSVSASIDGLQQIPSQIDPIAMRLTGRLENEMLKMSVSVDEADGLSGVLELETPVRTAAAPMAVRFDPASAMAFETRVKGEISPIAALLASPEMVLSGTLDLDVTGTFPMDRGRLDGYVNFKNGAFEHEQIGVVLGDIAFVTHLDNNHVTLDSFDAKGRDGGTLRGKGVLALTNAPSNLELTANKLVVFKRQEGRATASGVLTLGYEDDLIELAGKLVVDEARINLDALPRGGKPTLDVTFPDAEVVKDETRQEAITRLNVSINSPGRIFLNGSGVDAEARVDAKVSGSFSEPKVNGTASIVRGRFSLLGKRFDLKTSSFTLTGDVETAQLNIEAVRVTDDLTGTIKITGTSRRPKVELTSDPSVPEDEVLSRILFGRSPSQLSALEAARLAAALAQLAGGGGLDMLGGLEESLGLDTLDLGQNDAGQFEVTTGKYLADDVYLELRSGTSGVPGVAVEWEPLDNVQVDVETIPGEGQSVSVKWKKDFE